MSRRPPARRAVTTPPEPAFVATEIPTSAEEAVPGFEGGIGAASAAPWGRLGGPTAATGCRRGGAIGRPGGGAGVGFLGRSLRRTFFGGGSGGMGTLRVACDLRWSPKT